MLGLDLLGLDLLWHTYLGHAYQVHDELIFEVSVAHAPRLRALVRRGMQVTPALALAPTLTPNSNR